MKKQLALVALLMGLAHTMSSQRQPSCWDELVTSDWSKTGDHKTPALQKEFYDRVETK